MVTLKDKYVEKLNQFREKILNELHKAFHEDHSDREIALSFSIGVFITSLPTLGVGLLLFVVLDKLFDQISSLALIASLVVLNPLIKPVFWLASINLGGIILTRELTVTKDPETALAFLIVGNLIIAVFAAVMAYFFALKAVRKYRNEGLEVIEGLDEALEKDIEQLEKKKAERSK